jgi:23S rRNA (uracil1939-C5)-methyltransferase
MIELEITDVAYGGSGVGRHEGRVYFVRGALPGEVVRAEPRYTHKDYAEARLQSVVHACAFRVEPVCPLVALGCVGCAYQHVSYEEEVRIKQRQLADWLERRGRIPAALCLPPIPSPQPLGYRNKVVLHAAVQDGRRMLGYFLDDNRTILDIPQCPLAVPPLNAMLADLRRTPAFLQALAPGASVTLRWTLPGGAVHWMGAADRNAIWLREQTCVGELSVPRASFFQVNPAAADLLVRGVQDILGRSPATHVFDLYGGVGIFALAAAQAGKPRVAGLDIDEQAVRAALFNAGKLKADISFTAASAEDSVARALAAFPASDTLLIVDPPRAGLVPAVRDGILAHKPAEIVCISCAVDTFVRDLRILAREGYGILSVQLLDMFPRTGHFETIAHLRFRR